MNLKIRKMEEHDLAPLYELLSDEQVMKYLEPPYSKEQTARFLERAGLSEPPLIYAVEQDGLFIGYVIFHDYDETGMEIGWVLHPRCWGNGVASALTGQLIERSRELNKQPVIECVPGQETTRHIAMKFGFDHEGRKDGLDVFRLKR